MNYYERHIGDYAKDTGHLSLLEHGVYSRLLDVYYSREGAIPDDQVHRLIGCRTPQDRKACDAVLAEFFKLVDGAWRQARCDAELEKFASGAPEREAKQANRDLRVRRHRAERADLFRKLHAAGQHADWNIPIKELRALVERYCEEPATKSVTAVTAPVTPVTGTLTAPNPIPTPQSPYPIPQTPYVNPEAHTRKGVSAATPATSPATPEGNGRAPDTFALTERIKAVYPAGTYGQQNWILAEREISKLLAAGEDPEKLVTLTQSFAAQQDAKKSTGTQFVRSPESFFGEGYWRGPFPLPVTPQPSAPKRMRTAQEIAALYPEDAA